MHFVSVIFPSHSLPVNCDQAVSVICRFSEDICTVFNCFALLFWTYLFVFCAWPCLEFDCFHLHECMKYCCNSMFCIGSAISAGSVCIWIACNATRSSHLVALLVSKFAAHSGVALYYDTFALLSLLLNCLHCRELRWMLCIAMVVRELSWQEPKTEVSAHRPTKGVCTLGIRASSPS